MNRIAIIAATPADREDLFAWRNDPVARGVSKNKEPVPWETHVAWFSAALASPNRTIYVGYCEAIKIGSIRFDRIDPKGNAFVVSILIAPEQRGRGFGRALLKAGIEVMPEALLVAEIAVGNLPSRRIFESCGFDLLSKAPDGDLLQYRRFPQVESRH